MFSLPFG
jgi:Tfp pilus assembly protein PilF